jgi:hypothetical protein
MKHLYYGESGFLVGDEVADVLVDYTVMMAKKDTADSVTVVVLGPDGNTEESRFVIGPATMLTAETTRSELEEPDNSKVIEYMRARMEELSSPRLGMPLPEGSMDQVGEDYL